MRVVSKSGWRKRGEQRSRGRTRGVRRRTRGARRKTRGAGKRNGGAGRRTVRV